MAVGPGLEFVTRVFSLVIWSDNNIHCCEQWLQLQYERKPGCVSLLPIIASFNYAKYETNSDALAFNFEHIGNQPLKISTYIDGHIDLYAQSKFAHHRA